MSWIAHAPEASANGSRDDDPRQFSVTLEHLKRNDPQVSSEVWQYFFHQLLPIAHTKAKQIPDTAVDEEDVLINVFDRFFRAVAQNRFTQLDDWDDVWQILLMLTERELNRERRRSLAKKRGGDFRTMAPRPQSVIDLRELADKAPSPPLVASFNDDLAHALDGLVDEQARTVALLKQQGFENAEIAKQLNVSLSTIERKLRIIRMAWATWFDR